MKWFNTNAIHNYLNAAIAIVAGGALLNFDWTMFGITNVAALKITGGLSLAKIVINAVKDGPNGMVTASAPPVPPAPAAEEK